jgi:hypothetical protein
MKGPKISQNEANNLMNNQNMTGFIQQVFFWDNLSDSLGASTQPSQQARVVYRALRPFKLKGVEIPMNYLLNTCDSRTNSTDICQERYKTLEVEIIRDNVPTKLTIPVS